MAGVELHPYQRTLLELIWDGVAHPEYNEDRPVWRVWDYVARLLEQRHPDIDDALDVWNSLPVQTVPVAVGVAAPYGLVWTSRTGGVPPIRDSQVGLTIAGLRALAPASASAARCADNFAAVVGAVARADDQLEPTADRAVEADVPLERFTEVLRTRTKDDFLIVPDEITLALLRREPVQVDLNDAWGDTPATVHLGARRMRRYREVRTAKDHLGVVERLVGQQARPFHTTSLGLLQTFDYLGYVLKDHPEWTTRRLTMAPDLESAAAISGQVTTAEEFSAALSGLSTLLDQLQVREIPADDPLMKNDPKYGIGSINRLQYWMNTHIAPEVGREHIDDAIRMLRDIKTLRIAAQHPSPNNKAGAAAARARFGLSEFSADYTHMWELVRSGVANALDLLRVEVQAAQRSAVL